MFKPLLAAFIFLFFTNFSVNSQKLVHSTETKHAKIISSSNYKALYYKFEVVRGKMLDARFNFDMLRAEKLFRKTGVSSVPDLKSFFKLSKNRFLSLSEQSDEIKLLLKVLDKEYTIQKNGSSKNPTHLAKSDVSLITQSAGLYNAYKNSIKKMKSNRIHFNQLEPFIEQADLNYFSNSKVFFALTKDNFKNNNSALYASEIKLIVKQIDKLCHKKFLKLKTDVKLVSLFERYMKVKHSASKANFNYRQLDIYLNQSNRKFLNGENTFLSLSEKVFFTLSNLYYKDCLSVIEYIESCLLIDSSKPKL